VGLRVTKVRQMFLVASVLLGAVSLAGWKEMMEELWLDLLSSDSRLQIQAVVHQQARVSESVGVLRERRGDGFLLQDVGKELRGDLCGVRLLLRESDRGRDGVLRN
jgi:hypothetical protein